MDQLTEDEHKQLSRATIIENIDWNKYDDHCEDHVWIKNTPEYKARLAIVNEQCAKYREWINESKNDE